MAVKQDVPVVEVILPTASVVSVIVFVNFPMLLDGFPFAVRVAVAPELPGDAPGSIFAAAGNKTQTHRQS